MIKKSIISDWFKSKHRFGVTIFASGAIKVEVGQPLIIKIVGSNKLLTDISISWKYEYSIKNINIVTFTVTFVFNHPNSFVPLSTNELINNHIVNIHKNAL